MIVGRFDNEEGMIPRLAAERSIDIGGDWSQVQDGAIIDVRITGHTRRARVRSRRLAAASFGRASGRLPRGRFSQFVGERWSCLVTEAIAERRRLVLSRRAVIEREKAEAKEKLMQELQVGHVCEGLVTRIQDFGAFVDIGGVDGLLHISRMAWQSVKHPSEILEVGQKVKVKVVQIDPESGKIGLSLARLMAIRGWGSR